jgi:ribosomal protein L31E
MEQHTPADLVAINKLQSRNFIVELRVVADSVRRKRRNGSVRTIKVFNVKEVGVARQIGQSNRG